MFAYCNNNPCNFSDPNGHMIQGRSEYGPNAMTYKSGGEVQWWEPNTLYEQENTFVYDLITDPLGTVYEIGCYVAENIVVPAIDFIEYRFSTPGKTAETFVFLGFILNAGANYGTSLLGDLVGRTAASKAIVVIKRIAYALEGLGAFIPFFWGDEW